MLNELQLQVGVGVRFGRIDIVALASTIPAVHLHKDPNKAKQCVNMWLDEEISFWSRLRDILFVCFFGVYVMQSFYVLVDLELLRARVCGCV